jgi:hypothetical protein
MKSQFVVAVVLLGALSLASGCASESTPSASPKDGGATGGADGSLPPSGAGGSGGASTGGASGSGGQIAGTGGAVGTGGVGATGGSGGSSTDGGADDGGGLDVADATTGTEGGGSGDAPAEQVTDDGMFPPNGPIGSCDPLNWMTSASNSAGNNPAINAIDGLLSTRWSTGAAQATGQYYEIDFGGFVQLNQITLNNSGSPGDHPRGYEVHTSRDDFDFSTVIATGAPGDASPPGNLVTIDFLPRAVRFLRIQMTSLSGSWWSIHELAVACQIPGPNGTWTTDKPSSEGLCGPGQPPGADGGASDAPVDGTSDGGTADAGNSDGGDAGDGGEVSEIGATDGGSPDPFDHTHWTVSASSTSANAGDVVANAIDGNIATRWSSGRGQTGDEFFKVDLGSVGCVSQIRIVSSGTDFAAAYSVNVSTDNQTYVRVAKGVGSNLLQIGFSPRLARFIRINQLGTSSSWWSIDELVVLP